MGYDKLTAAEKSFCELGREENNSGDSARKPGSKARQITRTLGAATKSLTKSGSIKLGGDVRGTGTYRCGAGSRRSGRQAA